MTNPITKLITNNVGNIIIAVIDANVMDNIQIIKAFIIIPSYVICWYYR